MRGDYTTTFLFSIALRKVKIFSCQSAMLVRPHLVQRNLAGSTMAVATTVKKGTACICASDATNASRQQPAPTGIARLFLADLTERDCRGIGRPHTGSEVRADPPGTIVPEVGQSSVLHRPHREAVHKNALAQC